MKNVIRNMSLIAIYFYIICFPLQIIAHEGDTLKCNFDNAIPNLYSALNGGFISGTNGFGDLEVAQKFGVDSVVTSCAAEDSSTMSEILI